MSNTFLTNIVNPSIQISHQDCTAQVAEINALTSVQACFAYFQTMSFQVALTKIRNHHQTLLEGIQDLTKRREVLLQWARDWTTALREEQAEAWEINFCRKIVLAWLYRLVDITFDRYDKDLVTPNPKGDFGVVKDNLKAELVELEHPIRLIMELTLCMDRCNALYNMIGENSRGLHWYAMSHIVDYSNVNGPTQNKRFGFLVSVPELKLHESDLIIFMLKPAKTGDP